MPQDAAGSGNRRPVILWLALALAAAGLLVSAPAGLWASGNTRPEASDVGALTKWPLPATGYPLLNEYIVRVAMLDRPTPRCYTLW
jgi:hypothetical protein